MKGIDREYAKNLIFASSSAFVVTFLSCSLTNDSTASYVSGIVTYWGALILAVKK